MWVLYLNTEKVASYPTRADAWVDMISRGLLDEKPGDLPKLNVSRIVRGRRRKSIHNAHAKQDASSIPVVGRGQRLRKGYRLVEEPQPERDEKSA